MGRELLKQLVISLLFVAAIAAQEEPKIPPEQVLSITKFDGINTAASDFAVPPTQARVAINWDFGRNPGSLTKRFGYDSVGTAGGSSRFDSLLGIYGAPYSDGRQWLVLIGDSAGQGYGGIYTTPFGSANVKDSLTRRMTFWGIQNKTQFTMHRDYVYMSNGQQRGAILTQDGHVRSFPVRAGGEPLVVPLKHATGEINGEVVYTATVSPDTSITGTITTEFRTAFNNKDTTKEGMNVQYLEGVMTQPVFVSNGRVMLRDFVSPVADTSSFGKSTALIQIDSVKNSFRYWVSSASIAPDTIEYTSDGTATLAEIRDSLQDSISAYLGYTAYAVGDSTIKINLGTGGLSFRYRTPYIGGIVFDREQFKIKRSAVNFGVITPGDSANVIFDSTVVGGAAFSTFKVIDSLAGGSPYDELLFTEDRTGRDSSGVMSYRYGAIGFLSADSVAGAADSGGLFRGWPIPQPDTLGVVYTYAFIDTLLGLEGDTARSLFVHNRKGNGNKKWDEITLRLPKANTIDSGLVINLYRAAIYQTTHDSSFWITDTMKSYIGTNPRTNRFETRNPDIPFQSWYEEDVWYRSRRKSEDVLVPDSTIVGTYYLLKQIPISATDTTYTDTLSHKSLMTHRPYRKSSPPTKLKNIVTFQDRVYGSVGSRLYVSRLDSGFAWGAFDFISLDESDGDEITAIIPAREVIKVYKNNSRYNVFQDDLLRWNRQEIGGQWGAVASHSAVQGVDGDYYLSRDGVIRESEGQYRDRTFGAELISLPVQELKELPINEKASAVGHFLNKDTYLLSFPTQDTTYAFFLRNPGWVKWSFDFGGATNYATEYSSNYGASQFLPLDTMYFFRPGGKIVYRYGSSETDNGAQVRATWISAPLLTDEIDRFKNINAIGIGVKSFGAADSVALRLYDEFGVAISGTTTIFDALTTDRFPLRTLPPKNRIFYQFELATPATETWTGESIIDRIDVYFNYGMKKQRK